MFFEKKTMVILCHPLVSSNQNNHTERRKNMHPYLVDRGRLDKKLVDYAGGQFLMETKIEDKEGMVFRGEIRFCSIPNMNQKLVLVYFNWLCERRFGTDEFLRPIPIWVLLKPPLEFQFLSVKFTSYYFQRKKEGREERIKMWTDPLGEVCRFFKKGDPSNLKQKEPCGEFSPCYKFEPDSDL